MNDLKVKNYKVYFTIFLFFYLLIGILLNDKNVIFKYSDEIIAIILSIIIFLQFLHKKINKENLIFFITLIFIGLIGFLANFMSEIQKSFFPIVVDYLGVIKIFLTFFGITNFLNIYEKKLFFKKLGLISYIFLLVAFICGIISLFFDIGMSGDYRFGVRSFRFIFKYEHEFSVFVFSFLLISLSSYINKRYKTSALIFAIVLLFLSTKGPSFILAAFLIYFYTLRNINKQIRKILMPLLFISCVGLSMYQIQNYLLNSDSARSILYKYGWQTFIDYFPFGTGFATYGSDMAYKYYSSLYFKYGFNNMWGLSKEQGWYLNDNYFPMLIGQFGIFSLLFIYLFYFITKKVIKTEKDDGFLKYLSISILIYYFIHSVGSAILTSSVGVLGFFVLGLYCDTCEEKR